MAIQPDVYPGRKTTKDPGQKAIPDPGLGPGQSLQDPGHLPRLPPPGTATVYSMVPMEALSINYPPPSDSPSKRTMLAAHM